MESDKTLILNRIKQVMGLKTDKELAQFLEITPQTLSNNIKRNSIDLENVLSKCELINLNWLFTGSGEMFRNINKNAINGDNNIQNNIQAGHNSNVDARQYYSDSPDVLRAQIDALDVRIKEKDAQIKEKDAQINKLLNIMSK
ncbi:MAG: helix-turn-helix domain containing protein [Bacteroidales bacterium]|jgi:hypothetical protein|nr:helix-turn-helix domain containing protein [Bacteroidales bacterium]